MSRQPDDLELFSANNHALVRKVDIKNEPNIAKDRSYNYVFDILDYPTLLGKIDKDMFIDGLMTNLYEEFPLTRKKSAQLLEQQLGNYTKAVEMLSQDLEVLNDKDAEAKLKAFRFNFLEMVLNIINCSIKYYIINNKEVKAVSNGILNIVEKAWVTLCKYPSSSIEMHSMAMTCITTLTYLVSSDEPTLNHIVNPVITFVVKLLKEGGGNIHNKMMSTYQQQLYEILWRVTTAYPTIVFNELLVNDSLENFIVNFKFPCKNYYNNLRIMYDLLCCTKDMLAILKNATTALVLQVNVINDNTLDDLVMIKVNVMSTLMTERGLKSLPQNLLSHIDFHGLLCLIVGAKGELIALNKNNRRDVVFLEDLCFIIFNAIIEEEARVWMNLIKSDRCIPFLFMYARYKKETEGPLSYSDVIYLLNKILTCGKYLGIETNKRDSIQIALRYDELFKHYEAVNNRHVKELKKGISEIKTVSVDDDVEIIVTNKEAEAMQRNKRKTEAPVVEDPTPANKKQKSDAGMECIICMEENKSVVFFPCGHIVYCQKCNKKTKEKICPICRAIIKSKRKCYI